MVIHVEACWEGFRREAAEESLGHKVRNEVESRYRRTDILDERRKLMDAWEDYARWAQYRLLSFIYAARANTSQTSDNDAGIFRGR